MPVSKGLFHLQSTVTGSLIQDRGCISFLWVFAKGKSTAKRYQVEGANIASQTNVTHVLEWGFPSRSSSGGPSAGLRKLTSAAPVGDNHSMCWQRSGDGINLSPGERPSLLVGGIAGTGRGGSVQMGKFIFLVIPMQKYQQPVICEMNQPPLAVLSCVDTLMSN